MEAVREMFGGSKACVNIVGEEWNLFWRLDNDSAYLRKNVKMNSFGEIGCLSCV